MSDTLDRILTGAETHRAFSRHLGIFAPWRLQAYGYTFAALYALLLLSFYIAGIWLVDSNGVPAYTDFTNFWAAGLQVLRGETASIYVPAEFTKVQEALVGTGHYVYSIWPYPPTFFLILAPFAMLPYVAAFLTWDLVTLSGCVAVVYLTVRRSPAIALVLASPFTAWNLIGGQDGFLTASLLGASLLVLERHPTLAGILIGCLTFKPQFGILIPVALGASSQWRAFASAAATATLLAGASMIVFGTGVWAEFPQELFAQASEALFDDPTINPFPGGWGHIQSVYGLIRALHAGPALAWIAQGVMTFGLAIIVWLVWRSRVRYSLKAATLSAAALIATPYAYAYDMAAIAIPLAFLAKDQMRCGLLRGEQATMIALFGASFVILVSFGYTALGPLVITTLLSLVLRRDLSWWEVRRPAVKN
jgi:arabinofuranan 3-O-arabinosyltransferase